MPYRDACIPSFRFWVFEYSSIRVFEYLCPYAPLFPKSQSPPVFLSMKSEYRMQTFFVLLVILFSHLRERYLQHSVLSFYSFFCLLLLRYPFLQLSRPDFFLSPVFLVSSASKVLLLCTTWVLTPWPTYFVWREGCPTAFPALLICFFLPAAFAFGTYAASESLDRCSLACLWFCSLAGGRGKFTLRWGQKEVEHQTGCQESYHGSLPLCEEMLVHIGLKGMVSLQEFRAM